MKGLDLCTVAFQMFAHDSIDVAAQRDVSHTARAYHAPQRVVYVRIDVDCVAVLQQHP